ncbi:MAG TPA: DinB family protein [Acidobacteriaceae bacterium]|nr:DinB family protein [Acidobacteriaceae bacterium]
MLDAFRIFARYNRIANELLYEQCAQLNLDEYRRERRGSFGSIHNLLNHILLGDRIWMSRFAGGGKTTPPLNTILFDTFPDLQTARKEEDAAIEAFFEQANDSFLSRALHYTNSRGVEKTEPAPQAVLHFFNHQTHHRGQVHVMLSQTDVKPPSLDMHRILNP